MNTYKKFHCVHYFVSFASSRFKSRDSKVSPSQEGKEETFTQTLFVKKNVSFSLCHLSMDGFGALLVLHVHGCVDLRLVLWPFLEKNPGLFYTT